MIPASPPRPPLFLLSPEIMAATAARILIQTPRRTILAITSGLEEYLEPLAAGGQSETPLKAKMVVTLSYDALRICL